MRLTARTRLPSSNQNSLDFSISSGVMIAHEVKRVSRRIPTRGQPVTGVWTPVLGLTVRMQASTICTASSKSRETNTHIYDSRVFKSQVMKLHKIRWTTPLALDTVTMTVSISHFWSCMCNSLGFAFSASPWRLTSARHARQRRPECRHSSLCMMRSLCAHICISLPPASPLFPPL